MTKSRKLIDASDVHFAYGAHPVLDGIDFHVNSGEIFGLVGADGAGKTTLLRLAAGQQPLKRGRLRILDKDPLDATLRDDIAYMPQGFGLYRDLSVLENLQFFADLHGLSRNTASARIHDLLQRTGLAGFEARRASQLSGGMMQKLALACALVSEPRVMFLDEATTGVDPGSRRAFWQLLEGVRAEGVAILYATANMDEAERCDRIGMLQHGRLTKQGTPLSLLDHDGLQFVEISGARARVMRHTLRDMEGVRLLYPVGRRINAWLDPDLSLDSLRARLADSRLDVETRQPTLHDTTLYDLARSEVQANDDAD
jgi:ABC-2 type transport system ATP-binding protein